MNADKMYEELVDEIGVLPVICNEGLEHSGNWVEVESQNGEEKVIVCFECGEEILKDFMKKRREPYEDLLQNVWEDLIKKNQVN